MRRTVQANRAGCVTAAQLVGVSSAPPPPHSAPSCMIQLAPQEHVRFGSDGRFLDEAAPKSHSISLKDSTLSFSIMNKRVAPAAKTSKPPAAAAADAGAAAGGVSKPKASSDERQKEVSLLRAESSSGDTFWVETTTLHEFAVRRSGRVRESKIESSQPSSHFEQCSDCIVVHISNDDASGLSTPFGLCFSNNVGFEVIGIARKSPACGILQIGSRILKINNVDVSHVDRDMKNEYIVSLTQRRPGLSTTKFHICPPAAQ
jgi:hypothetical protein